MRSVAGWDTEYRSAAALGMSVVLFQGFYQPYWSDPAPGHRPRPADGQQCAVRRLPAGGAGLPESGEQPDRRHQPGHPGHHDRSGCRTGSPSSRRPATVPGIYVGVPQVLTTADLDSHSADVVFWRSASGSAPQVSRGYVMRQPTIIDDGLRHDIIDTDISGSDNRGAALVGAGFPARRRRPPCPARSVRWPRPGSWTPAARRHPAAPTAPAPSRSSAPAASPPPDVSAVVAQPHRRQPHRRRLPHRLAHRPRPTQRLQPQLHPRPDRPQPRRRPGRRRRHDPDLQRLPRHRRRHRRRRRLLPQRHPHRRRHPRTTHPRPHPGHPRHQHPARQRHQHRPDPRRRRRPHHQGLRRRPQPHRRQPHHRGYLTAWPTGQGQPTASNLNFTPGQTVPNLVVVPVGTDGTIQIFNGSPGTVDVIVDVAGYYLSGTPTAAGTLGPLTPARILDTRGTSTLPRAQWAGAQGDRAGRRSRVGRLRGRHERHRGRPGSRGFHHRLAVR